MCLGNVDEPGMVRVVRECHRTERDAAMRRGLPPLSTLLLHWPNPHLSEDSVASAVLSRQV